MSKNFRDHGEDAGKPMEVYSVDEQENPFASPTIFPAEKIPQAVSTPTPPIMDLMILAVLASFVFMFLAALIGTEVPGLMIPLVLGLLVLGGGIVVRRKKYRVEENWWKKNNSLTTLFFYILGGLLVFWISIICCFTSCTGSFMVGMIIGEGIFHGLSLFLGLIIGIGTGVGVYWFLRKTYFPEKSVYSVPENSSQSHSNAGEVK